jgi:hypothetical protein
MEPRVRTFLLVSPSCSATTSFRNRPQFEPASRRHDFNRLHDVIAVGRSRQVPERCRDPRAHHLSAVASAGPSDNKRCCFPLKAVLNNTAFVRRRSPANAPERSAYLRATAYRRAAAVPDGGRWTFLGIGPGARRFVEHSPSVGGSRIRMHLNCRFRIRGCAVQVGRGDIVRAYVASRTCSAAQTSRSVRLAFRSFLDGRGGVAVEGHDTSASRCCSFRA